MGVFSGELGAVSGASAIKDWSISEAVESKSVVSSATKRGTARTKGINAWSGSYKQIGAKPTHLPGDIVSFIGWVRPTTGVEGTAGLAATGSVVVNSVAITWNWGDNSAMETSVNFQGSGALAWNAAQASVVDATMLTPVTPNGLAINMAATPLPDVISATFTLSRPVQSSVSSSSGGNTVRTPGGAFDWALSIVQYNESGLLTGATIGSDQILTLPAGGVEVWDLKWGQYLGSSGLKVDRAGTLIQRTLNFAMNGVVGNSLGWIKKPGAVDIWPIV